MKRIFPRRPSQFTMVLAVLALFAGTTERVKATVYVVDGHSGPWQFVDGGLNTSFQYGVGDQLAPTVVLGISPGNSVTVSYVSGFIQNGFSSPFFDAAGDLSYPNPDSSPHANGVLPGFYTADPNATFAYELTGTFADNLGQIIGTPFRIPNGPINFTVPVGATQLQLGVNDNLFGDNSGAWNIDVTIVPEPSTLALLGIGAGVFVLRRCREGRRQLRRANIEGLRPEHCLL